VGVFLWARYPCTGGQRRSLSPRRSLSLKLRDTRVYEPQIRACLGITVQVDQRWQGGDPAGVRGRICASSLLTPTGPNPLYHRDDLVDRPRATGVWIPFSRWPYIYLPMYRWTSAGKVALPPGFGAASARVTFVMQVRHTKTLLTGKAPLGLSGL